MASKKPQTKSGLKSLVFEFKDDDEAVVTITKEDAGVYLFDFYSDVMESDINSYVTKKEVIKLGKKLLRVLSKKKKRFKNKFRTMTVYGDRHWIEFESTTRWDGEQVGWAITSKDRNKLYSFASWLLSFSGLGK